jgi:hypothetical protein
MKESYVEGPANHCGLEPYAGAGVALARGTDRRAIELRNQAFRVPKSVVSAGRQHARSRHWRVNEWHGGVEEPRHVWKLQAREPGDPCGFHFLGFSYGFRPGRSCHQALDALSVALTSKRVNWVLDADIEGFFDTISHQWLIKFLEHRIGDRRILRLIRKWLRAGVSEEGRWFKTPVGTPQGAVISPLLANVFLHYCGSSGGGSTAAGATW